MLGANGFGYKLVDGRYQLAGQLGWVELGADVEIGAGATVDRGTYGPTVLGEGTKVDTIKRAYSRDRGDGWDFPNDELRAEDRRGLDPSIRAKHQ